MQRLRTWLERCSQRPRKAALTRLKPTIRTTTRTLEAAALALALTACGGGGGGGGDGDTPPAPPDDIEFAPENAGHYSTEGFHSPTVADAKHAPVWRDDRRIGVGIDQGATHLPALPVVARRGDIELRYGALFDNVDLATLAAFMADTNAGATPQPDPVPPVTVSWDASASDFDQQRVLWAVQMVNAALPESYKIGVAAAGGIRIKFISGADFERLYGTGWGISLYDGGIEVNRDYTDNGDRQAIILLAHELMHKMEFSHPSDQRFDTIIEAGTGSIYRVRQDEAQPLSLLYPLDRAALRRLYDPNAMGPWSERALHVAGHGTRAAFGVALRNGYAEPWAYGYAPPVDLADNRALSGAAAWAGAVLGLTPAAQAVAGDASIIVNLAPLTGTANFTNLEAWAAYAAPGAAGTGSQWLDGDLRYAIAVRGNTFRETGGDAGRLTGIFTGAAHEGAAGTLERSDLTAAFGASR